MVSVPRHDGRGETLVSRTPITNGQYSPVILRHLGEGAQYVELRRGLNGRIAVTPLNENAARDNFGPDKLEQANSGKIVQQGSVFLYKLVARPSPENFDRDKQPVVYVSPVEVEGWCELAGGGLHLLSREQMIFTLQGGERNLRYPTATGELFDKDGKRLLHGNLKLEDGRVVSAGRLDVEYATSTCDVDVQRYPDGPFGTRLGGNVILIGAHDLFFGASWLNIYPEYFESSNFNRADPDNRVVSIGFCVGASA
jgi:formylglycine-generating enzyme required for sulfatase activity